MTLRSSFSALLAKTLGGALGVALLSLTACTQATPYRYTALVPGARPIAWDGRGGKEGALRLQGSVDQVTIASNPNPQIHDTAVLVPRVAAEGSATLAVADEVELGVRGYYAAYGWADESAYGTMPLPSQPSSWGVGPEIRATIPLDDRRQFALGIGANLMRYEVPYAEWSLTGPNSPHGQTTPCTASSTCVTRTGGTYALFDERSESHLTYAFGLYPSIALGDEGEYGHAFGYLGGTNGFRNDGFTDTPTNGSTVSVTGPVWMVGGGYGADFDVVHASGMVFKPLTTQGDPVNYGIGFHVTLGLNLEVWQAQEERKKPKHHYYAPTPAPAPAPQAPTPSE
jgi:hypothetical protein